MNGELRTDQDWWLPKSAKVIIGYSLGGFALLLCLFVAIGLGGKPHSPIPVNVAICLSGFTFGWVVGLLISPAKAEAERFKKLGGAILTFVSGFVVAKLEPVVADAIKDQTAQQLLNDLIVGRVSLFGTTFLLGALFVFVGRSYWDGPQENSDESDSGESQEPQAGPGVVPGDSTANRGVEVEVTFNVQADTQNGQNLYLVGDHPLLGKWTPESGTRMAAHAYPVWSVTVSLPASTAIQYKYVKRDDQGVITWEGGGNRSDVTPASGVATLYHTFQSLSPVVPG